ncbi:hypothetical protein HY772_10520, partial [Candidatus Woesearchaeota archaeon]|nr:hypothetical protein [Candidatus Woesearchaeota archaeon]
MSTRQLFKKQFKTIGTLVFIAAIAAGPAEPAAGSLSGIEEKQIIQVTQELSQKFPASEKDRLQTGVRQVAARWIKEDGGPEEFQKFCLEHFFAGQDLEVLFERFENKLEFVKGHFTAMQMQLKKELDEDTGPMHPVDEMFAAYAPSVHMTDDLFKTKLAFVVLLNYPIKTLEEMLANGSNWSRRQWAEARLAQTVAFRVPAGIQQQIVQAYTRAETYISNYNIHMDRVADDSGKSLFPAGLKLISHWGLRDELKSYYPTASESLPRQKAIYAVMEKILTQEIPQAVIANPALSWNPFANTVDGKPSPREEDARYSRWQDVFKAHLLEDPYYPGLPTHIDRQFKLNREMTEAQVEDLLASVLKAPVSKDAAKLIKKRLGRKLLPFDIWYNGFKAQPSVSMQELDKIVSQKYPSVEVFQKDLPNILQKYGFSPETAEFLASKIEVDPARGAGHAMAAEMRTEKSRLRTKFQKEGMNYQGFNIAMHELGHCVEQTFSLYKMDHNLLSGVPNTAFTEAFAFVFQDRDLEMLGLNEKKITPVLTAGGHAQVRSETESEALKHLDEFWATREIAGVGLVDMKAWRWLYQHPQASPAEFRQAVVQIAKDVWNEHYAPVFGVKDVPILAIYSHLIEYGLYLPNYPLGHIIAFQVGDYYKTHALGQDMERMCKIGNVTPE